jgi:hypothetical protein
LFEIDNFLVCEGIGFGNDGDKVDFGVEAPHELDINGLEARIRVVKIYHCKGE